MMTWLAAKGLLGLKNWMWLAIAGAIVVAAWVFVAVVDNAVEDTLETTAELGREAGRSGAVIAGQDTTLGQIGAANAAEAEIRNDAGFARYCECVRNAVAGTAGNCIRRLENKPVPGGPADPVSLCPR